MHKTTTSIITMLFAMSMQAFAGIYGMSLPTDTAALQTDSNTITDKEIKSDDPIEELPTIGEGKSSFGMPEGLAASIDSLLNTWQARNLLNALDCENEDWKDIKTSDTTYAERLQAIPSIIDMPYNSMVRACIDRYLTRNRSLVSFMLGMSEYYMPMIEEEIDRQGIPKELRYLPVIESALNPKAVSPASAKGLWQFIFPTAKLYGLKSNNYIDERFDPIKSTKAAVHYLRDLYKFFNNWELAIAAYNCGPGNVKKAIVRSGGKKSFWEIYDWLPYETRGYLPAFIAANYVMTYHKEHGICPMEPKIPITTDTIHISKNLHFTQIAEVCGADIEAIRALNPQYIKDIVPGENERYVLRLPNELITSFIESEDSIYKHREEEFFPKESIEKMLKQAKSNDDGRGSLKRHKIRQGENLGSIARKYRVTVKQIMRWNNMRNTKIRAGKYLKIYK